MQDDIFFEDISDEIFMADDACIELAPYGSFPVGSSETSIAASMATMAETLCYHAGHFLPARRI